MSDLPSHEEILRRVGRYRSVARGKPKALEVEAPAPGGESVWDYPRPPEVRRAKGPVRVDWAGETMAESAAALRIVETAGAPVYYIPPQDVRVDRLRDAGHVTLCEWKGAAVHYDLVAGDRISALAAFAYPEPLTDLGMGYDRIAGWIGFYPSKVDACWLAGERVSPQPGGYYAGWVTADIFGPIKGAPGTQGW